MKMKENDFAFESDCDQTAMRYAVIGPKAIIRQAQPQRQSQHYAIEAYYLFSCVIYRVI